MTVPNLHSPTAEILFLLLRDEVDTEVYQHLYDAYLKLRRGDVEGAKIDLLEAMGTSTKLRRTLERLTKDDEYRDVIMELEAAQEIKRKKLPRGKSA